MNEWMNKCKTDGCQGWRGCEIDEIDEENSDIQSVFQL